MDLYYKIIVFVFGLVFGSFYNVIGYRLPNGMSIVKPSSSCPKCNHKLRFYELIPVISYVILRGKCSKCKNKISLFYPIFELLTGFMFLISYIKFGFTIDFLIAIIFVSILIIISISDIKYYIIPDEVLITGAILLIITYIINMYVNNLSLMEAVIIPLLNGLGSFSLLYLIKIGSDYLFKKESLGGGDVKLLFIIGLVIGFEMSIVSIFIASFIALPLSMISLFKKDENIIPFGPYLSIAAAIILFLNLNLHVILEFFTK